MCIPSWPQSPHILIVWYPAGISYVTKHTSSQVGSTNMTMSSVYSNRLDNQKISIENNTFGSSTGIISEVKRPNVPSQPPSFCLFRKSFLQHSSAPLRDDLLVILKNKPDLVSNIFSSLIFFRSSDPLIFLRKHRKRPIDYIIDI